MTYKLSIEQIRLIKILFLFGYIPQLHWDYFKRNGAYDEPDKKLLKNAREKWMHLRKGMNKNERFYYDTLIYRTVEVPEADAICTVSSLSSCGNFLTVQEQGKVAQYWTVHIKSVTPIGYNMRDLS